MGVLGGIVASAAGTMAGGAAAGAMGAGKQSTYGPDTRIPGVTSATIKKGQGKGQPDEKVPQIDISQALAWADEAAQTQDRYYREGLSYYQQALNEARKEINRGFTQANQVLMPLHYSSTQALNEQMRMLGLDPIQATVGFGDTLKSEFEMIRDQIPEASGLVTSLASQFDKATQFKNKDERDAFRQQLPQTIQSGVQSLRQQIEIDKQNALKALGAPPAQPPAQQFPLSLSSPGAFLTNTIDIPKYEQVVGEWQNALNAYNAKKASIESEYTNKLQALDQYSSQLDSIGQSFLSQYTSEYDKGYTEKQVEEKITSTPGYKFQYEQGQKGIERQMAARGMLGSGNTLLAAQEFGQNLAQNYYNTYMDRLGQIVQEGMPGTMQLSANKATEGQLYAGLKEAGGQATMNTYQNIGNAYATSLYNKSSMYIDAAKTNAALQMQGIEGGKNRQNQLLQQQIASQPGLLNAQSNMMQTNLAQAQFLQAIANSQNIGMGYLRGIQGGGFSI